MVTDGIHNRNRSIRQRPPPEIRQQTEVHARRQGGRWRPQPWNWDTDPGYPAVCMSCMSQNFLLFHISNLSVRNSLIFLLMCTGSQTDIHTYTHTYIHRQIETYLVHVLSEGDGVGDGVGDLGAPRPAARRCRPSCRAPGPRPCRAIRETSRQWSPLLKLGHTSPNRAVMGTKTKMSEKNGEIRGLVPKISLRG